MQAIILAVALSLTNGAVALENGRTATVTAADCTKNPTVVQRMSVPQESDDQAKRAGWDASLGLQQRADAWVLAQKIRRVPVELSMIKAEVTTTKEYCGNADHQTLMASHEVSVIKITHRMLDQYIDGGSITFQDLADNGKTTIKIKDNTAYRREFTTPYGVRVHQSSFPFVSGSQITCLGRRTFFQGHEVDHVVTFAAVSIDHSRREGLMEIDSGKLGLLSGETVCSIAPGQRRASCFRPDLGSIIFEAREADDATACDLRRLKPSVTRGNSTIIGDKEFFVSEEMVVEVRRNDRPSFPRCPQLLPTATNYADFYLLPPSQYSMVSGDYPTLHNFHLSSQVDSKDDLSEWRSRTSMDRLFTAVADYTKDLEKQAFHDRLRANLAASRRLVRMGGGDGWALFHRSAGSIIYVLNCSESSYAVSQSRKRCGEELAVEDASGGQLYVAYPERVIVDAPTHTECDEVLCEGFHVTGDLIAFQCPDLTLENASALPPPEFGLATVPSARSEFRSVSEKGLYTGKQVKAFNRKLMKGYKEGSVSEAATSYFSEIWDGKGAFSLDSRFEGSLGWAGTFLSGVTQLVGVVPSMLLCAAVCTGLYGVYRIFMAVAQNPGLPALAATMHPGGRVAMGGRMLQPAA